MTKYFFTAVVILAIAVVSSALIRGSRRSSDTCGVSKVKLGLIIRGQEFKRGSFPWTVALMNTTSRSRFSPPEFFCAGTLISRTFVISAAHCILPKQSIEELMPRNVLALFGAHDLRDHYESGRYSFSPKRIFIHNEWNHQTAEYDADVSLLEFEDGSIYFNSFVQPICLFDSESEPAVTEGTVTGWGKSEDPSKLHENIPKLIKAQIQHNDKCLPGQGTLATISSERTFCAGLRNGSGVCSGDSGSGLSVEVDGVSYLKGIVSSSLIKDGFCDISNNAIYTNVPKFQDWIRKKTKAALLPSASAPKFSTLLPEISDHRNIGLINKRCGVSSEVRIVGGNRVEAGDFPWMALLQYKDSEFEEIRFNCAGTLISKYYVLTAAQCIISKLVNVRLGEHDLSTEMDWKKDGKSPFTVQNIDIESTIMHPNYDRFEKVNDIALIRLKSPANLEKQNIGTICLPVEEGNQFEVLDDYDDEIKENLIIAGWGRTENGNLSEVLMKGKVYYIKKEDCIKEIKPIEVQSSWICTKGKTRKFNSCRGDGGGPLFAPAVVETKVKFIQYGIVSTGFGCDHSDENYPGIFTNVGLHM